MSINHDRRRFLQTTAAVTAATLAGSPGQAFTANETLNIACLGTGGRCRALMRPLAAVPGVRIAAVCDVWDVALAEARKLADPKAAVSKNYKEILNRRDIDAVLIGS